MSCELSHLRVAIHKVGKQPEFKDNTLWVFEVYTQALHGQKGSVTSTLLSKDLLSVQIRRCYISLMNKDTAHSLTHTHTHTLFGVGTAADKVASTHKGYLSSNPHDKTNIYKYKVYRDDCKANFSTRLTRIFNLIYVYLKMYLKHWILCCHSWLDWVAAPFCESISKLTESNCCITSYNINAKNNIFRGQMIY